MLTNATIKHLNQLQQKKYREEFKEFLVEGIKGVQEALSADAEVILVMIDGALRDQPEMKALSILAEENEAVVEYCGRKDIGEIKTTDTFPGVLAVIARPDYSLDDVVDNTPIVCVDGLKDPGNLGTIIRTADWFGIKNIILAEDSVDPYNPKVVRSTMGSMFRVNVFESTNIVQTLQHLSDRFGYKVYALDMTGEPVSKLKAESKSVLLFGSESHGIRPTLENLITKRYTIPGKGAAESLNVAVAAGIVMNSLDNK